ncbi:hypothetical protein [Occallatibacter savannae]|uniref:hypothetical protein n=1 Tax=Occallatibacter savannae TaxID=1002691 RepID=UPI000D68AB4F|nr:hypothetical protein [Occallatibacter savannae]
MMPSVRNLGVASSFVLVSALLAAPPTQAQSAYIYVQSTASNGPVYGYSASSSGQLTAISGSPFKPGTAIIGSNKSQFFTLGKTTLHAYAVGSNGAIGAQVSQIPLFNYAGGFCGYGTSGLNGGVLDHSGQYVYVLLWNGGDGTCTAYQTYKANSGGTLTFVGDTEVSVGSGAGTTSPSILGTDTFAYADEFSGHNNSTIGFMRESSGTLQTLSNLGQNFPTLDGGAGQYTARHPDASPTGNYVVLQLYPNDSNPPQLGSYTVDSNGNLSTTNTSSNMPTSALSGPFSTFSKDGKMFALYANAGDGVGGAGNGIEIYNFNGASPLTLFKKILTGTPIDDAAWDSSNHLYAISRSLNKIYVFTVTSTSVTQNSSYSITNPLNMIVVSRTSTSCSAPSGNGVNVCSPAENASVSSPVQVNAAATVSGGVYRFELWSGSTKLASVDNSGVMNQSVSLAAGSYHLTFVARNTAGTKVTATRDITVK